MTDPKPHVIAQRSPDVYLVRFPDGDAMLDVRKGTLSVRLPHGSWIKDPYWDEVTMPDAVLAAWLKTVTVQPPTHRDGKPYLGTRPA